MSFQKKDLYRHILFIGRIFIFWYHKTNKPYLYNGAMRQKLARRRENAVMFCRYVKAFRLELDDPAPSKFLSNSDDKFIS